MMLQMSGVATHDLDAEVGARRSVDVVALTCCLVVAAPLVVAAVRLWNAHPVAVSDVAIIELQAHDVGVHTPLVGPQSRFGFSHPGPALFYWLAPFIRMFGNNGSLLAAVVFNSAMFVAVVRIARKVGSETLAVVMAIAIVLFERSSLAQLVDAWNPWIALSAFLAFAVGAWGCACGQWSSVPVTVLAGSFALQTHVGYVYLMASVGIVVMVMTVKNWHHSARGPMVIAGVIGVAMWIPVVIDQLSGDQNLSKIWSVQRASDEPRIGFRLGAEMIAHPVGAKFEWIWGRLDALFLPIAPLWWLVPVLLCWLAVIGVALRGGRHRQALLLILCCVMTGAGWWSFAEILGLPYPYLGRWAILISMLGLVGVTWCVVDVIRVSQRTRRVALQSVSVAGLCLALVVGLMVEPKLNLTEDLVGHIRNDLIAATEGDDVIGIRFDSPFPIFGEHLAAGNQLTQAGHTVVFLNLLNCSQTFASVHCTEGHYDRELIVAVGDRVEALRSQHAGAVIVSWTPEAIDVDLHRVPIAIFDVASGT